MTPSRIKLKYLACAPITNGLGLSGAFDEPTWPRYIRTTDIRDERTLRDDVFASQPPVVAAGAQVQPRDILMTAAGATIGKSYLHYASEPACYAGYLALFRPRQDVDERFISFWMQSSDYWAQIEKGAVRSTIDNFSAGKYRQLLVPDWPFDNQRLIADFLDDHVSRIDEVVRLRREQIDALRTRTERRLHDILVPRGSVLVELRRLGTQVTTGPFGTVFAADDYVTGGVPMINPTHIRGGRLVPDEHHTVSPATAVRLSRHRLVEGDLVTSRKGDLGRTALVDGSEAGWICGSDSIAIHPDRAQLVPAFLDMLLWLPEVRAQLLLNSVGATMPSLSEGNLRSLRVPRLPIEVQAELADTASKARLDVQASMSEMTAQIALLEERKRSLVTAAVLGEFDVTTASGRGI